MKLHWSLRLFCAALIGYVWSLGFDCDWFEWFGWILPGALIFLSLSASRRLALGCGFLFGVSFQRFSIPWVYSVMHEHGGLDPLPAAGVMGLLVVHLAVFPALFSMGVAHLAKKSAQRAIFAAPFLWVTTEFAQTHFPYIGFPWNLAGYIPAKHPAVLQLATLTGIYGLSFLIVACGALFAWVMKAPDKPVNRSRRLYAVLVIAAVVALCAQIGARYIPQPRTDHVAVLVQLNFPESPSYPANWMDMHAGEMDELEKISVDGAKQSAAGAPAATLIVWPEVPAPFYFLEPKFAARAEKIARDSGANFLVGVLEWRAGPNNRLLPYNSAVMLDASGKRVFQYDKIHLVPFGEYVPLRGLLKFAGHLVAEVGDYHAGTQYSIGELPDEPAPWEMRTTGAPRKFGAFICFEAVFPNLVRQFTANGAELLINISNDGWYGRSAAPDQHLAMARVRAVENRRWLLRATNNGYTVAIDPYGREVARMAPDVRGTLRAPFSFRSDRTIYSRWGDWFAWMCVIVALVFWWGNLQN
jgi:apolipoprotein N-acyltransferase